MESEKTQVRKTKTSCSVRNRWNANHYDRINVTLPKGYGDIFKEYCAKRGTTMNALISQIIKFELEQYEQKRATKKDSEF